MYAFRPDWWDLGWNEGSRTYITALSIRAIEDYLYMASVLDRKNPALLSLERNAVEMRSALTKRLWDDSLNYLINYNGADKDHHRYMGSLLAPAYKLLDRERSLKLIETAKRELLAPNVGIRAVMPSDFHKDSVIKYFRIAGSEAGDAYTYINGGVWPHNNAWYALAQHAAGKSDDALDFVKRCMTVDGIAQSPNGIPAMYEYRYSNEESPRYGEIDKPSFLWAGGFYLYTMYSLAGATDNVWNLSFSQERAHFDSSVGFSYTFGIGKDVMIDGIGRQLATFAADGKKIPSLVLPMDVAASKKFDLTFGNSSEPFLSTVNAIVHTAAYTSKQKRFVCALSSFKGHQTIMTVVVPKKPREVHVNGKTIRTVISTVNSDNTIDVVISFVAGSSLDTIELKW